MKKIKITISGLEYSLLVLFGFLTVREFFPELKTTTDLFMPLILPVSEAVRIIYTFIATLFFILTGIFILTLLAAKSSPEGIKKLFKNAKEDSPEVPLIKPSHIFKAVVIDTLMIYFSWFLGHHYFSVLVAMSFGMTRAFASVYTSVYKEWKILMKEQPKGL
jgi:predicted outer membrane lipoprotein